MDLRRIRHFVVLAETLNYRRAAERLHMAQPPLTVSIQKLEAELGTKLFERGSTGVALTPNGRAVLAEARKLLFHGGQLQAMAHDVVEGTGGFQSRLARQDTLPARTDWRSSATNGRSWYGLMVDGALVCRPCRPFLGLFALLAPPASLLALRRMASMQPATDRRPGRGSCPARQPVAFRLRPGLAAHGRAP